MADQGTWCGAADATSAPINYGRALQHHCLLWKSYRMPCLRSQVSAKAFMMAVTSRRQTLGVQIGSQLDLVRGTSVTRSRGTRKV